MIEVKYTPTVVESNLVNSVLEVSVEAAPLVVEFGGVSLTTGVAPYEHIQSIPAAVWTVEHSLGRMPSVTVLTSAGDVVYGHVNHSDTNELTITFSAAFAGRAYLV